MPTAWWYAAVGASAACAAVVAPNASACGAPYQLEFTSAAIILVQTPSMGKSFYGTAPVLTRSFPQQDAAGFCRERADIFDTQGGMAAAATVSDWRMMELACSSFSGLWTGIRATLDDRGSASAPGVRWRFTGVLSAVDTDDALLNSLRPDPDWSDARCNCAWDAGYPRDVLRSDGNLTDNVCVYLHNRACDGLDGDAWRDCARPAVPPPAERWRGVYLRNAPCSLQLPSACCSFQDLPGESGSNLTPPRNNEPPRFAAPSFPDNPALDVRVADAWPPGTVLLQRVPAVDADCRSCVLAGRADDNSAGAPYAMTQLRLLSVEPGGSAGNGSSSAVAAPVITLDPIRGALLYTGSGGANSSSGGSRAGASTRVRLGVLDEAGCTGVEPLEVRVTVLPSYRVDGDASAPLPPDAERPHGGFVARRTWAPNSPPLLLPGVPAENASLWPHRAVAPPAVVFALAGQGAGTDVSVVAYDSDPCPPPAARGGVSRTCAAARVDAVIMDAGTCPTCEVLVRTRRPQEGALPVTVDDGANNSTSAASAAA